MTEFNPWSKSEEVKLVTTQESELQPIELKGVTQIMNTVDQMMPAIEKLTGLQRRDIFLQLMKTGIRGGNLTSVIDGLMGVKPQPASKFEKYVKTLCVWVPVAFILFGLGIVGMIALLKLLEILL